MDKHTKRSIGFATCCEIITKICQAARVGIHLGDKQGTHTSISPVGKKSPCCAWSLCLRDGQFVVRWFPAWTPAASSCMAPSWHLRSRMGHFSCIVASGNGASVENSVDFWFSLFSSNFAKLMVDEALRSRKRTKRTKTRYRSPPCGEGVRLPSRSKFSTLLQVLSQFIHPSSLLPLEIRPDFLFSIFVPSWQLKCTKLSEVSIQVASLKLFRDPFACDPLCAYRFQSTEAMCFLWHLAGRALGG